MCALPAESLSLNEGILINAIATLTAALAFLFVATEAQRKRIASGEEARGVIAFLLLAGVHLFLAGLRQAAAFVAQDLPVAREVDVGLFYMANVLGALTVVPLVHVALSAAVRRPGVAHAGAGALMVLAAVGLARLWIVGVEGPVVGYWGSDWVVADGALQLLIVAGVGVPALAASVGIIVFADAMGAVRARRARLLAASALVYYAAMVPDGLGLDGAPMLLARLVAAGAAYLAYHAYFPKQVEAPRRLMA